MHEAVQKQIRLHRQSSVLQELCHLFLRREQMVLRCAERVDKPDLLLGDTSQSDGLWIVPYLRRMDSAPKGQFSHIFFLLIL